MTPDGAAPMASGTLIVDQAGLSSTSHRVAVQVRSPKFLVHGGQVDPVMA